MPGLTNGKEHPVRRNQSSPLGNEALQLTLQGLVETEYLERLSCDAVLHCGSGVGVVTDLVKIQVLVDLVAGSGQYPHVSQVLFLGGNTSKLGADRCEFRRAEVHVAILTQAVRKVAC